MAQRPDDGQGVARDLGDPLATSGGPLLPRWALLSLVGCGALAAPAIVLWYAGPCLAVGPLAAVCRAAPPAPLQVAAVVVPFLAGWVLAYVAGYPVQEPAAHARPRHRLLRELSDFVAMRPVVDAFGLAGAAGVVAMAATGTAQPVVVTLALLPGAVALWGHAYRSPLEEGGPESAQDRRVAAQARRATAMFRFRSLPPVRYVWPNRPPPAAPPAGGRP